MTNNGVTSQGLSREQTVSGTQQNHVTCRCGWVAPMAGMGPIWELLRHQVDAHGEIRKARVIDMPTGMGIQRRREHVA